MASLLATHSRGNHGGIAPTLAGEPAMVKWTHYDRIFPRGVVSAMTAQNCALAYLTPSPKI